MTLFVRYVWAALRLLLIFTIALGIGYPVAVFASTQVAFHSRANGSMVAASGRVVGSSLIGQDFSGPKWFHPRASAAGSGYDAMASSASNLSPSSGKLLALVQQRKLRIERTDHVAASEIPADAVTASGSGLDPDISPQYAALQVTRVAQARGLSVSVVRALVNKYTVGRTLGFLGEPTVNVLSLNIALASTHP